MKYKVTENVHTERELIECACFLESADWASDAPENNHTEDDQSAGKNLHTWRTYAVRV